jgi:hypothetical protein
MFKRDSLDDFMNKMDLGDPDPSNHRTRFDSADEIVDWFRQDRTQTTGGKETNGRGLFTTSKLKIEITYHQLDLILQSNVAQK